MGVNFTYNGNTYYPRYNGTVRINVAEKIGNFKSKIVINTEQFKTKIKVNNQITLLFIKISPY